MKLDDTLRKGFRLGDWVVKPIEGVVMGANESRHLQPKTMDVLVTLAESSGQVLTRDELIRRVWGANAVSDEPLTRCIHELRRSLDDNCGEPTFIQTIPKRGYRLLTEVCELSVVDEMVLESTEPGDNPLRQVTRQRVLWVGLGYAALAWVFVQLIRFAELQASAQVMAPDWLLPTLILLLLAGFPIAVFFAWFRQLQIDGLGTALSEGGTLKGMRTVLWSRRGIDMVLVTMVIAVLAGFAFDITPAGNAKTLSRPSIAVLPFATANEQGKENWLGRGMAEDLYGGLVQYDGLLVSSISVSFRESLQGMKPQQIGQDLNAQYLLRGLVVRSPESLRVKARLIDSVTGLEVWAGYFSGGNEDLFSIQNSIVSEVLAHLGAPAAKQPVSLKPVSMAAYDSYLRGREVMRGATSVAAATEAALWFEHALATDERMPMARNALCEAYVLEMQFGGADGIYGRANSACAEALLRSPKSVDAHLALANFYRVTGHSAEAKSEYQWVIQRQGDNASAWFGLARAYADLGEVSDTEKAYRRVLEIKPDCADAHEAFTAFLISEGRYPEALELARYLVRLDSDRISGYQYLSTALFMNGHFRAAIKASREVLSRDIKSHSAVMQIASSYYFLGDYESAINIYAQAAKLAPDDYLAHGGLGAALFEQTDEDSQRLATQSFARARHLVEQALLNESGSIEMSIDLAYYCASLGDQLCAQRQLADALIIAPDNMRSHYIAALVYASAGDLRAASVATQRALALGYPESLIATHPLLASAWTEHRSLYSRLTVLLNEAE